MTSHIRTKALEKLAQEATGTRKVVPVPGSVYYVNFPDHPVEVVGATGGGGTSIYDKTMKWMKGRTGWGGKLPLGHAGILIKDKMGRTRYYEYGRYPNGNVGYTSKEKGGFFGNFVRRPVPDFRDMTDQQYVERLGTTFSKEPRIQMYGTEVPDIGVAERFILDMANNKNREPYSVGGNNCGSVARRAIDAARGWDGNAGKALDFVGGFTPGGNAPSLGTNMFEFVRDQNPAKASQYKSEVKTHPVLKPSRNRTIR